jgi:pilus assembly protein Flp/PilA
MIGAGLFQARLLIRRFVRDERAATMVEYALMLALIAVVCIVAVRALGGAASGKFNEAANVIGPATP